LLVAGCWLLVADADMSMLRKSELTSILSAPLRRSLSDEVVVRLREAILNGKIAPGDRLREKALAESMSVSRGPVREAIQKLEREGLVVVYPNRGAVVARLAREDLEEVYSLRRALERLAIQEAVHKADDAHLAEMTAIVDEMKARSADSITEQEAADLDTRFHQVLVESSGHKRLIRSWMDLLPQIHLLLLSRTVANADFREHLVTSHTDILKAIKDQDEARALILIEDHLKGSYERVRQSYSAR
jgi:DNA-binding GntR family transcriptional regulator